MSYFQCLGCVHPTFTLILFGPSQILLATTTSADFLLFVVTTFRLVGSPRVSTQSFTSSLPSLRLWFRLAIGLHVIWHTYPPYPPEMISVRQYEVLLSLLSAITLLRPPCDSLTLAARC
jgi:hypothetical protein